MTRRLFRLSPSTLACCLLVLGIAPSPAQAQSFTHQHTEMKTNLSEDYVTALNRENLRHFLSEVSAISTGKRPDMLDDDVVNYFANHITDNAKFDSFIRYNIPGYPAREAEMTLGKKEYIASVVQGRYMMEDYTTSLEIRDLNISRNGKHASFTSVTAEEGRMPFPKDMEKPNDVEMVPIEGESVCEQVITLSENHFIQMKSADCETTISFDPFGGKPLIPE